ncbi:MAG TPA: signal recognition particle protein [Oligoflexus sp.]|uniref:signal recognition particle protein n=1 Tax=Oligoflexus sp. TaxID=1971216 RepID=UPI002D436332|nr:signal recognition particle protein [Oligoflexus sp.]HYX40010.1 signal recognition particle protein [Oligoflexus sp.]
MLDVLSEGFKEAKLKLKGKAVLNESNVKEAIDAIRKSLLEADVEYSVTKNFLQRVQEKALGQEVQLKAGKGDSRMAVTPADHFVAICKEELEQLMGPVNTELTMAVNRPTTIMMVGLQGSGKTTSTGKLAKYLVTQHKKKPLLVAADIYRPAAVQQLKVLGERIGVPVFHKEGADPVTICKESLQKAFELGCDIVLFDTAGRLTIDSALMQELADIQSATKPDNVLLVCDSMMGQDAVTTAKSFDERLSLSGVIMTKLDGDARGGAALSIKEVTGKPIKFLGMGEDLDRLEEFRPEGLASRILGLGDIVGLMQDFQKVADDDQEAQALKLLQGQFSYIDFYKQIEMIQKMGSLKDLIAKMPMQDMIPKGANIDDRELTKVKAMIDSMTKRERVGQDNLDRPRMSRIARGSGRPVKEVEELHKRFTAMRKMMGMLGKNMGGLMGKIPGMGTLNQMNNMRKAASQMGQMPSGMGDMAGMFGGEGSSKPKPAFDRDKQKKMRKAAKDARKRNRK